MCNGHTLTNVTATSFLKILCTVVITICKTSGGRRCFALWREARLESLFRMGEKSPAHFGRSWSIHIVSLKNSPVHFANFPVWEGGRAGERYIYQMVGHPLLTFSCIPDGFPYIRILSWALIFILNLKVKVRDIKDALLQKESRSKLDTVKIFYATQTGTAKVNFYTCLILILINTVLIVIDIKVRIK